MPYKDKEKKRIADQRHKARKREANKKAGLCVNCYREAMYGHTRCKVCYEKHREHNIKTWKIVTENRIRRGTCAHCGCRPPMDNSVYCLYCRNRGIKSQRMF